MAARVNLAELRFNRGLSPEQLGEKVGVSGRTIRRLERGRRPNPETAFRVASFFGLQPADIWPVEEREAA